MGMTEIELFYHKNIFFLNELEFDLPRVTLLLFFK